MTKRIYLIASIAGLQRFGPNGPICLQISERHLAAFALRRGHKLLRPFSLVYVIGPLRSHLSQSLRQLRLLEEIARFVELAVLFGEYSLRFRQSSEYALLRVNEEAQRPIHNDALFSKVDGRFEQAGETELAEAIMRSLRAGEKSGRERRASARLPHPRNGQWVLLLLYRVVAGIEGVDLLVGRVIVDHHQYAGVADRGATLQRNLRERGAQ